MRNAFLDTLYALAVKDPRINLIVGDLGFSVVERFARNIPRQFLNAGIAEQNMTGVAAGMALSGKKVFTYSIGNFPTMRCLEQVRNDVCYHNADVKIVSVGAGFSYGTLGMSHHATEDIAIMRALPGMRVIVPADPVETAAATKELAADNGPCYLRLGKAGEPVVHEGLIDFKIGRAITLREGRDVCIIGAGAILKVCVEAAKELAGAGISARVVSMHTIKPLDTETLSRAVCETRAVITVEEHNVIGGLGGAVAEFLVTSGLPLIPVSILGIRDSFCRKAGTQDYLRSISGISASDVAARAKKILERR